jgi:hypothetical protein
VTVHPPFADDVLAMFAVAFRRDPVELGAYCVRYPELASQFVELAHELALQEALAGDAPLDAGTERWLKAVTASGPDANPFAGLDQQAYGALRRSLGVPGIVLNGFRDRLVAAGTVPLGFLERLADGLGTGLRELAAYLAGPPTIARAVRHKADGVPAAAADKISFADLLDEASMPPDRVAELLADED